MTEAQKQPDTATMPQTGSLLSRLGLRRHQRELATLGAYAALLLAVGIIAPSFFNAANWRDLAVGMTLVILAGQIDISVGSQFAVCSVAAGWLAKAGVPVPLLVLLVPAVGALMGAVNGAFVAKLKMPAIVVTLAMLVAWRDALRWVTEGAWVQGLPAD